jgi:hypothetical protein
MMHWEMPLRADGYPVPNIRNNFPCRLISACCSFEPQ